MKGFGSILRDYLKYYKISQSDFADRLGITQKHMNEIINGKTRLSTELIISISLLTDIDANLIYYTEYKKKIYDELNEKYKDKKEINEIFKKFYLNELVKKNWIKLKDESSYVQKYIDLLEYLNVSSLDILDKYINNRFVFKKKDDADINKIYLWIKHCDYMTKDISVPKYNPSNFNDLLNDLKEERVKTFNKNNLINILSKYGIILYIEDALKGSKIRGCSKVMDETPTIYLTLYKKEKSSIYFALYHELMHIKKDYNSLRKKTIINTDEDEIDTLALNEMIDEKTYDLIINNYEDRDKICKNNKIPLSFLYTRLALNGKIKYSSKEYIDHIEMIEE